jgi:uncharacterized protein (TIGR03083 family)
MVAVELSSLPALDVRPMLTREREALLSLLRSLSSAEWRAETAAPGWTVKDVALHLLDDDLGWLSRGRDGDGSGTLPMNDHESFVAALAAKNQRWITGARGLSRPVVIGMLEWAGQQLDDHYASMDLLGDGQVSWASDGSVPSWFDIAQDLTERWVHQMQIREAVDRVEGYQADYLPVVLRTFVWALPHQYRVVASRGTTLEVDLSAGGLWTLTCIGDSRWSLSEGSSPDPDCRVRFADGAGWRWLTGARVPADGMTLDGPAHLHEPLLRVRGILA